jgi:inosine-uridine nucleoside N-ribohydrolase
MVNEEMIPCWLDCDPGIDDLFAILLAAHSNKIRLIGVSTVAGNQTLTKTTRNTLKIFNLFGLIQKPSEQNVQSLESDANGIICPIIKGCSKPLLRALEIADYVHGEDGLQTLSNTELPAVPQHAYDYVERLNSQPYHFTTMIYKYLQEAGKPITMICTGPLTNMALLLLTYPDCSKYIEKIVFMGGSVTSGNVTPVAEFNIYSDAEAAHIVFESSIPAYMVPLEATNYASVISDVLNNLDTSTNLSKILIDLLLFLKKVQKEVFDEDIVPLHDPCAVAFVIDPTIFEYKLMRVDVAKNQSEMTYGQTVCDVNGVLNAKKNVHVCLKMDLQKFWQMMYQAFNKANQNNPNN